MSEELTEQWREGKLPIGDYYIRVKEEGEEKIVVSKISGSAFFYDQTVLLEIVAPVPSYDEYCGFVQKMRIRGKKLDIALDTLGQIAKFSTDSTDAAQCGVAIQEINEIYEVKDETVENL